MDIIFENYKKQKSNWPSTGRHIMAQYDSGSIIVYQAYSKIIGEFAIKNNYFDKNFSLDRMSWIKPNFLWMMYRCGWTEKEGQAVVLGVRIKRIFFNTILSKAVFSSYKNNPYAFSKIGRMG